MKLGENLKFVSEFTRIFYSYLLQINKFYITSMSLKHPCPSHPGSPQSRQLFFLKITNIIHDNKTDNRRCVYFSLVWSHNVLLLTSKGWRYVPTCRFWHLSLRESQTTVSISAFGTVTNSLFPTSFLSDHLLLGNTCKPIQEANRKGQNTQTCSHSPMVDWLDSNAVIC